MGKDFWASYRGSESRIVFETRPLSLLRAFQGDPSIQWDNTVFPNSNHLILMEFALSGSDLFFLGQILDPDYSEVILEYESSIKSP
jgi:hypothetical protein